VTGLLGLSWTGLSLYGFSHFGTLPSVAAVNTFYFAKDLFAGMFGGMVIFVIWPQRAKIELTLSGILFIGFNIYAVANYDLKRLPLIVVQFYSINGSLIGTIVVSAIALWLSMENREVKATQAGGPSLN
jgi:hypothetical protein